MRRCSATAVASTHAPGVFTDLAASSASLTDPGLETLSVSAVHAAADDGGPAVGNGRNRGVAVHVRAESGLRGRATSSQRWGTNAVEPDRLRRRRSGSRVRSLVFEFDLQRPRRTPHEAMAAAGDSGGPVFVGATLAGILYAISTFERPAGADRGLSATARSPRTSSYYRTAILAVTAERACDDGARRRRRRR